MAELKREYVIPLRRSIRTAPKWRRSKKAVSVLKDFIRKHMKTDNVVICKELNEKIWANGIRNPPGKLSVIALKTDKYGYEMTLVNLLEVGLDKQVELYTQAQMQPQQEVQEAEVTEKPEEVKDKKSEEKSETKEDSKVEDKENPEDPKEESEEEKKKEVKKE